MSTGTIKWFDPDKGFGFIIPDDDGPDVFVHATAVQRAGLRGLDHGDRVSFAITENPRTGRWCAVELRLIAWAGKEDAA